MGHIHLGVLPKTKKWRDVVDLLTGGAADSAVISASALAAERDLAAAADSPVFVEALRILMAIPHAARSDDFWRALRDAGLDIPDSPGLLDILTAASARLDWAARGSGVRSDFGELSGRALVSTLSVQIGDALPGLFDATAADVQAAARRLSWSRGIADLTRGFFGRLVADSLSYWLDRTLALQVGRDQRFADASARSAFDEALAQYASEATRIIQEFAGGWYGKTLHRSGRIATNDATVFGAVAFKKITEELKQKRRADV